MRAAALAAALFLATPCMAAAQAAPVIDAGQTEGLMWLAAGCAEKASPLLAVQFPPGAVPTSPEACRALPISLEDGLHLMKTTTLLAPVMWCDAALMEKNAAAPPWAAALDARAGVDAKGAAWSDSAGPFVGRFIGVSAGWLMNVLKDDRGVCAPQTKAQAEKALYAHLGWKPKS